jgi:histidinol-phosphate aminotransferase
MNSHHSDSLEGSRLPDPIPALADLHRTREPGDETLAYVGLDRNERMDPLPKWFMNNIRDAVASTLLTRYPVRENLHRRLAETTLLPEERLLITPGSDTGVKALFHAYVRPGDGVVMLDPSYAMYLVYAQMFQARPVRITFDRDLVPDTKRLLNSIVPGVRLILLANPNQPTGTMLDEDFLLQVLERATRVGALLAIDEAYYPFSQTTALPWVKRHPHVLVLRTFSKAAGLAGLRIGFVAGHPSVINNLSKVRAANEINSFAILCAQQILAHPKIVDDYIAAVQAGAQVLAEQARTLGLTPLLPVYTNFMLIRVAHRCPPAQLADNLRSRGYLVKGPFAVPCLADCLRVTLGPPEIMTGFVRCLQEALAVS